MKMPKSKTVHVYNSTGRNALKKAMTSHAAWKAFRLAPVNLRQGDLTTKGQETFDRTGTTDSASLTMAGQENVCLQLGIDIGQFAKGRKTPCAPAPALDSAKPTVAPVTASQGQPDSIDSQINDLLLPFGSGDIASFRAKARTIIEAANKPAEIVEKLIYQNGEAPSVAPGKFTGQQAASDVFGIKGQGKALHNVMIDCYQDELASAADQDYIFDVDTLADSLLTIARGKHVYLYGPAGTGKTSLPMEIAARAGRACTVINCNRALEPDQLLGQQGLVDGKTIWTDGVLIAAMRRPGTVIVLDEPDFCKPGVMAVLQSLLDHRRSITIADTGETVTAAQGVVIFVASNTAGMGDETGSYLDRQPQDRANLDRYAVHIPMNYLDAVKEAKALAARANCNIKLAAELVGFANKTRNNSEIIHPLGLRRLVAWAELLTDGRPARRTFQITVVNSQDYDDRETLEQLYITAMNDSRLEAMAIGQEPVEIASQPENREAQNAFSAT